MRSNTTARVAFLFQKPRNDYTTEWVPDLDAANTCATVLAGVPSFLVQ